MEPRCARLYTKNYIVMIMATTRNRSYTENGKMQNGKTTLKICTFRVLNERKGRKHENDKTRLSPKITSRDCYKRHCFHLDPRDRESPRIQDCELRLRHQLRLRLCFRVELIHYLRRKMQPFLLTTKHLFRGQMKC